MKRATLIELSFPPRPAAVTLQHWLYNAIRDAIISGRLKPGARLPTSRDISQAQGVSRSTAVKVFEQLAAEGYLTAGVGRGSFVSSRLPGHSGDGPVSRGENPKSVLPKRCALSIQGLALTRTPFPVQGRTWPMHAFRPNQPDVEHFPFKEWHQIHARLSRRSHRHLLTDTGAAGLPLLRDAIATHLRQSRSILCSPEQIAIVGSVQQALDILSRLLLDPGDTVWVEEPGYPGARILMQAAGANVVGVPVDESGIDVAAGRAAAPNARMAYVTAGRHSPLGMPLALERRLALLQWATDVGAVVIEDDYDSEFRFSGAPLAALKSLDTRQHVVYAGNLNKMLFASLRLSFVVLPDWLVEPFSAALSLTARYLTPQPQAVLAEFIIDGKFGRHLRRMRTLYGERAEALETAVARHLPHLLRLPSLTMGLDTPALLPAGTDDGMAAGLAYSAGIETRPLSYYSYTKPTAPGLVLGFAAINPDDIDRGAATLARALNPLRSI